MKSKVMLSVLMLTCMALNVNLAWGAGRIEINTNNSGVTGAYQETTCTVDGIDFYFTNWMKNNNIQAKASTTYSFYNMDPIPGKITKVVVCQTGTSRAVQIHGSNFYDENDATEAGEAFVEELISAPTTAAKMEFSFSGKSFRYFYLTTPSNAVYMDSIVIYYESNDLTYTEVLFQQAGTPAHPDRHCVVIPFVQNCPQARRLRPQYSFLQAGEFGCASEHRCCLTYSFTFHCMSKIICASRSSQFSS